MKSFKPFFFLLSFLVFGPGLPLYPQTVVINEIVSSNGNIIADEDGDFEDWIELYNAGDVSLSLNGWFLSDDENDPLQWEFPDISIPAKGFLLIWASGKDRRQGVLHTNFKISQEGEPVLLSDANGQLTDFIEPVFISRNFSYGRYRDGQENFYFFEFPTPGASNNLSEDGSIIKDREVIFSHLSGLYNQDFILHLSTDWENATIYYTLDGSEPTEKSKIYSDNEGIIVKDRTDEKEKLAYIKDVSYHFTPPRAKVFKGTVVRAKAIKDGTETHTFTSTYLVSPEIHNRFSLPIVSVVTDSLNLFDYERGIMVLGKKFDDWKKEFPNEEWDPQKPANFHSSGREWEVPASFEYFEPTGERKIEANIGLRLHGNYSRAFQQKSFRLYERKQYRGAGLKFGFFKDHFEAGNSNLIDEFQTLILRNSGQDWESTRFKDAYVQTFFKEIGLDVQSSTPASVFLNGEYYGILNLRTRYDEKYFQKKYKIAEEDLVVLELDGDVYIGGNGDQDSYKELISFLRSNDIGNEEVMNRVKEEIDIDNFRDYYIGQIFVRNTDWPGNNIRYWRKKQNLNQATAFHDGKWRWLVFDTDFAYRNPEHNTLEFATEPDLKEWPNPEWSTFLFRTLLQNEEFKISFINRYADLLNTIFSVERSLFKIDSIASVYRKEIPQHNLRWATPVFWESKVEELRKFAQERPEHARKHVMEFFDLSGVSELNIIGSGKGDVTVSTLRIDEVAWNGKYFHDNPIQIKAVAYPGFRFVEWLGTGITESEIMVTLSSDSTFTAVFAGDETLPSLHHLSTAPYVFNAWNKDAEAGTFPPHMVFHSTLISDPDLATEFSSDYLEPYNLTSRSRINGLDGEGISFINTSNPQDSEGAGYLGAAVVGLNTIGVESGIMVNFTAGTVLPNSRVYGLRLQYKIGENGRYKDVLNDKGEPVEYLRNEEAGHEHIFKNIPLPAEVHNQPEVYLRWKYYYIETGVTGPRAELKLDDIRIAVLKYPKPLDLKSNNFVFDSWSPHAPQSTYPEGMFFYQTFFADPGLEDEMQFLYTLPYNFDSRSRINGLGKDGVSFINTANPQADPNGGYMGAALVSLKTKGIGNIKVSFTAGTLNPNNREYRLILQYRIGEKGTFANVMDEVGKPVEYGRNIIPWHEENFEVMLPEEVNNKELVHLRWKYYYIDHPDVSGPRAELRLDDILIKGESGFETKFGRDDIKLYPNPVTVRLSVESNLEHSSDEYQFYIIDSKGRKVDAVINYISEPGNKLIGRIETSGLTRGIYLLRIIHDGQMITKKFVRE